MDNNTSSGHLTEETLEAVTGGNAGPPTNWPAFEIHDYVCCTYTTPAGGIKKALGRVVLRRYDKAQDGWYYTVQYGHMSESGFVPGHEIVEYPESALRKK